MVSLNKAQHSLSFNASCGCRMAAAETVSSASKSSSGTSRARRRSSKHSRSPTTPRTDQFARSKVPFAQQIQAHAATNSIVNNTVLATDSQINLLAAKNESNQISSNSSTSGSIGMSVGSNPGVTVAASKGKGKNNGADTTYTNTTLTAGNLATIKSSGDSMATEK